MNLTRGNLFHIYNRGNNRRQIFFTKANYYFFIKKIKTYIHPYADIFAWCLMPNHFHLMILVNHEKLSAEKNSSKVTPNISEKKIRTINQSIAIMLRSYTRAIQKQEKISGSLFRAHTKAECINCEDGFSPSFTMINGITNIDLKYNEEQYPQTCFNYIHNNPLKANLCKNILEWEYSSAQEYFGKIKYNVVNKEIALEYIDY